MPPALGIRELLHGNFNDVDSDDDEDFTDPDYTDPDSTGSSVCSGGDNDFLEGDFAEIDEKDSANYGDNPENAKARNQESDKENGKLDEECLINADPLPGICKNYPSFRELALHPWRQLEIPVPFAGRTFTNEQYLKASTERQNEYRRLQQAHHVRKFITLPSALLAEAALRKVKKTEDRKCAEARLRLADARTKRDQALLQAAALLETAALPELGGNAGCGPGHSPAASAKAVLANAENVIQVLERVAAHLVEPIRPLAPPLRDDRRVAADVSTR